MRVNNKNKNKTITIQPTNTTESTSKKPGSKYSFSRFPLYSADTPIFRQSINHKFIGYGKNNDYPDYLAYLFNNSGIHSAIVKGKATYVYGKGFKIKKNWVGDKIALQKTLDNINPTQNANDLTKKKVFEKTLYGGSAYLITWGGFGKPTSVKLQPFNTIRTDKDRTEFYVSKEWTRDMSISARWKRSANGMPTDTITYPAFNPNNRVGKQILYITDENPASDIYPLPEYAQGATPIETDIETNNFQLNNVKTGFAAGTMVTFFNGMNDNEESQREIEKSFKAKTAGTDNAGELIMNFQDPGTTPPEISPLRSNELDKQYEQLSKDTINKILYAHRVSNGLLFGVKTPGELGGGRSEFDLAWEHFCNTYVKPKQQEEEEDMNFILSLYGFYGNPVELIVLDPIGLEINTADVLGVLTTAEKRKYIMDKLGIEAIVEETPKVEPNKFDASKDFILESLLKLGVNSEDYDLVTEAFDVCDHDEFDTTVELQDKIFKYLTENKSATIKELSKMFDISETKTYKILSNLTGKNTLVIKYVDKGGEVNVITEDTQDIKSQELETKYRYSTRDLPMVKSTTRDFCKQLINANRLYTREEIDGLQNEVHTNGFNEDVWRYKGGWMTVKGTDVHVPQCRHFWQQVIVKKK